MPTQTDAIFPGHRGLIAGLFNDSTQWLGRQIHRSSIAFSQLDVDNCLLEDWPEDSGNNGHNCKAVDGYRYWKMIAVQGLIFYEQ